MPMQKTIPELLQSRPYVLAPEIYDCISAKCVEACGFEATVLSSSEFANSYGYPDLGLLTLDDFVDVTRRICRCSPLPMIVDAEEGFGRPLHAYLTAERLAEAGAGGILITDLVDIGIKGMLSVEEAVLRFKAAKAGLAGTKCILVARTEFTPENPQLAYDRCNRYLDLGAEMTLIHFGINKAANPNKSEVCEEIAKHVPGWKWFPDLQESDRGVNLAEMAKLGFNFVGAHYCRTSAMQGMYDYGMHVFERQDNCYVYEKAEKPLNAPDPYSIGFKEWYERESDLLKDPEILNKGNYKMFRRFV